MTFEKIDLMDPGLPMYMYVFDFEKCNALGSCKARRYLWKYYSISTNFVWPRGDDQRRSRGTKRQQVPISRPGPTLQRIMIIGARSAARMIWSAVVWVENQTFRKWYWALKGYITLRRMSNCRLDRWQWRPVSTRGYRITRRNNMSTMIESFNSYSAIACAKRANLWGGYYIF